MKSKFITMWDLNVGVDINIYGKIFTLVECDEFTRHFLSCQGVSVPPEVPIPARSVCFLIRQAVSGHNIFQSICWEKVCPDKD